jgi:hypothetical protein
MVADYFHNAEWATEFWTWTFYESHPDPDHETRALTRVLKGWVTPQGYTQDQFRRRAQRLWNRYRKMKDLGLGSEAA